VLPPEVGLVLVGAPTHEFSLPKEQSRRQAVQKGAAVVAAEESLGVREWIGRVTPRADLRVVTFDTSLKTRFSPGFASKSAFKALRKRGFSLAERGQSFWVTGTAGPLVDGEELRAEAWGVQLGASLLP